MRINNCMERVDIIILRQMHLTAYNTLRNYWKILILQTFIVMYQRIIRPTSYYYIIYILWSRGRINSIKLPHSWLQTNRLQQAFSARHSLVIMLHGAYYLTHTHTSNNNKLKLKYCKTHIIQIYISGIISPTMPHTITICNMHVKFRRIGTFI